PVDPTPAWYGFSIAKWEGDTFVVESAGFNDQSWLDNGGHPRTDALHLTERFRRVNFGNLELDITIDDPKAYTRPWKSVTVHFVLMPDTELIEQDRKSTRLNSSHVSISYAVFCLKKKNTTSISSLTSTSISTMPPSWCTSG